MKANLCSFLLVQKGTKKVPTNTNRKLVLVPQANAAHPANFRFALFVDKPLRTNKLSCNFKQNLFDYFKR